MLLITEKSLIFGLKKLFFILFIVKHRGFEIISFINKPIQSKITAIHKTSSPNTKIDLINFIASMKFYSTFNDRPHVNMKPLYGLL